MRRSVLSLVALLLLPAAHAVALDPDLAITQYVQNIWRAPQHLPHDDVSALLRTRDGYLWVGTVEGLARFDGVRSVFYDKSNTPAIANNWIRALLEDRQGRLWIGTFGGGLVCRDQGKFRRYGPEDGIPNSYIAALFEDHAGRILAGTYGGVYRLEKERFVREPGTEVFAAGYVRAIVEDRNHIVWYGTDTGLYGIGNGKVTHLTYRDGLADDMILSLAADDEGLWIGTEKGGVNRLVQGKLTAITTRDGLTHSRIWSLFVDSDRNLWIGTDGGGLNRYSKGRVASFTTRNGLTNDYVWAITEDREGSLWVGTNGGGLNRLKTGRIVSLTTREGLPSDFVWSILRTRDGTLCIGTEDAGLVRIRDGQIQSYPLTNALTSNAKTLFERRDGTLLVGGSQGLEVWKDGHVVPFGLPELAGPTINAIVEEMDGTLWIGTNESGLKRVKNGVVRSYMRADGLSNESVTTLLPGKDGTLWVGTVNGLSRLTGDHFTTLTSRDRLAGDYVTSLFQTSDGSVWVALRGGLTRINRGRIQSLTSREGLCDDSIMTAIPGDDGRIWMGSNRGLFRVSMNQIDDVFKGRIPKVDCTAFGVDDGMKNVEVNGSSSSAWRDPDGRLWFSTRAGLASVDSRDVPAKQEAPPVLIEEVVADGKPLPGSGPWRLPAGTFSLEIHFTSLSLVSPSSLVMKYMLEGFDPDWTVSGTDRTARYTNLRHGKYVFRVIAGNRDDVWNTTGARVSIEVAPRIYETLWFRLLIVFIFVLAGPLFYLIRVNRLGKQKGMLERLVAERTAEVQAANARLEQLAREDALTSVANRRRLDEALDEEWRRAHRMGTALAFLLIDVDFFKNYNDHHGHVAGDECLKTVAARISDVCRRAGELVARYGGEEFAVILPGINRKTAENTAEVIRRKIEEEAIPHPESVTNVVTVSVGVAWMNPREGASVQDLISAADQALYLAKKRGRNRVEVGEETAFPGGYQAGSS